MRLTYRGEDAAWISASYDPQAAAEHPEWLHAPQHHEWLSRFPDYTGGHPALVSNYVGLNGVAAAAYRLEKLQNLPDAEVFTFDLQGPPMGCGCGNPSCRSWDNSSGPRIAATAYENPEVLFPLEFARRLQARNPQSQILPVLVPECERGFRLGHVEDPDGPEGTNLCQGIPCQHPCALDYFPRLLAAFREEFGRVAIMLSVSVLEKGYAVFGEPGAWSALAHRHYGTDLIPVVDPREAARFKTPAVITGYDFEFAPMSPPPGFSPTIPPIMCGYCPPASDSTESSSQ